MSSVSDKNEKASGGMARRAVLGNSLAGGTVLAASLPTMAAAKAAEPAQISRYRLGHQLQLG